MRDFFAILMIVLAVITLGVFRVPDENALVAAGIKAEAEGAVYQARHPLRIEVENRTITVSGRVESEAEAGTVLEQLSALQGVEEVVDGLSILPNVTPFRLAMKKSPEGFQLSGHVPDQALAVELGEVFGGDAEGLDALELATGAPDGAFGEVARVAARALTRMEEGQAVLQDRTLVVSGQVHLPLTETALRQALAELPEGYSVRADLEAIDDGLPYSLVISRDPLMGLRISGKLPPDFDFAAIDALGPAQQVALARAPMSLNHPGFTDAAHAALGLMQGLPMGVVTVAPGVVTVEAGPLEADMIRLAEDMGLPEAYARHLLLVPEDDGPGWSASVEWDGQTLAFKGRVPADFSAEALVGDRGVALDVIGVDRSPYPDLAGWQTPLERGISALLLLRYGALHMDDTGLSLSGLADNPATRQAARVALGAGESAIQLADDGAPASFRLTYDPARGGAVSGKLPAGLSPGSMAEALGLAHMRGSPKVASDDGGDDVLQVLAGLRDVLSFLEVVEIRHDPGDIRVQVSVTPGADTVTLEQRIANAMPQGVELRVATAGGVLSGTRRTHVVLQQPQVFVEGYWLPQVATPANLEACGTAMAQAPSVAFPDGGFVLAFDATHALGHLAAVARACTRLSDAVLLIDVAAGGTEFPILDRQLARRRAEALRDALVARGIATGRVETRGAASAHGSGEIRYSWQ